METLQNEGVRWLITYGIHSTALVGLVWLVVKQLPKESNRAQEFLWRAALLGPLFTATLQAAYQYEPLSGRIGLPEAQNETIVFADPAESDPTANQVPTLDALPKLAFETEPDLYARNLPESVPTNAEVRGQQFAPDRFTSKNHFNAFQGVSEAERNASRENKNRANSDKAPASAQRTLPIKQRTETSLANHSDPDPNSSNAFAHLVVKQPNSTRSPATKVDPDVQVASFRPHAPALNAAMHAVLGTLAPEMLDNAAQIRAAESIAALAASQRHGSQAPVDVLPATTLLNQTDTEAASTWNANHRTARFDPAADTNSHLGTLGTAGTVSSFPTPDESGLSESALTSATTTRSLLPQNAWRGLLLGCWAIGGSLGLVLLLLAWRHIIDRIAGRSEMTEGPMVDILQELSKRAGMRTRPRLCLSTRLGSPATIGVLRSQICVPEMAVEGLTAPQQRAMLGHELAHIRRHDPQWFFLYRMVERVFFFQPLNRLARQEIQELAEYQCDDWAALQMGRGLDLARCLTEVAGWMVREQPQVALLPMAGTGSLLGHRVRRLLDEESRTESAKQRPWGLPLATGMLAAGALILPGVAAQERDVSNEVVSASVEAGEIAITEPLDVFTSRRILRSTNDARVMHLASNAVLRAMVASMLGPFEDDSLTQPASNDAAATLDANSYSNPDLDRLAELIANMRDQIAQLQAEVTASGTTDQFSDPLLQLQRQVQSLSEKQARLQRLMQQLRPTNTPNPSLTSPAK